MECDPLERIKLLVKLVPDLHHLTKRPGAKMGDKVDWFRSNQQRVGQQWVTRSYGKNCKREAHSRFGAEEEAVARGLAYQQIEHGGVRK